jgi:hypothetical protein
MFEPNAINLSRMMEELQDSCFCNSLRLGYKWAGYIQLFSERRWADLLSSLKPNEILLLCWKPQRLKQTFTLLFTNLLCYLIIGITSI